MIDIRGIKRVHVKAQEVVKLETVSLDGFTRFYIGCNISVDEMQHWSAQKITDFFMGIAKVVYAADDRNWQPKEGKQ